MVSSRAELEAAVGGRPTEFSATVREVCSRCEAWSLGYYVKRGQPTKQVYMIARVCQRLTELYGDTCMSAFDAVCFKAVRLSFVRQGWARSNVASHCKVLRRILRFGEEHGLVRPGLADSLKVVAPLRKGRDGVREAPRVHAVDRRVYEATAPFIGQPWRDMLDLMWATGMRPGEVCAMRACDVNTRGETWWYAVPDWKCSHNDSWQQRVVVLEDPMALNLVRARVSAVTGVREPLFINPITGRQATPCMLWRAVQTACDVGRQPYWHPNMIRHAVITAIWNTAGPDAARRIAGHTSIKQTLAYVEVDLSGRRASRS